MNTGETGITCNIDQVNVAPLYTCYNASVNVSGTAWTISQGSLLTVTNITYNANATSANILLKQSDWPAVWNANTGSVSKWNFFGYVPTTLTASATA